jgi:hypothetical protein
MYIGREREAVGWAKISNTTPGDDEEPLPRWVCVGAPKDTWAWWGSTAGEAWAVCDASGEVGIGYFGPIKAVHRPWLPEERASFTLGTDATDKNSSSLQEIRGLALAVEDWVGSNPEPASVFNFFTDAKKPAEPYR